jgi:MFS family permease
MLGSFVLITALSGAYATQRHPSLGLAMVPFIFIFMGFYSIGLTPVPYLYVPEISSTSMRAKSMALYIAVNNVTIAFNSFVNPIALAGEWPSSAAPPFLSCRGS